MLGFGKLATTNFNHHTVSAKKLADSLGEGILLGLRHSGDKGVQLVQYFTMYKNRPFLLLRTVAEPVNGQELESRNISSLCMQLAYQSRSTIPGDRPMIVDLPFDNDNWLKLLALPWPEVGEKPLEGVSHELAYIYIYIYDQSTYKGIVLGSLEHDFWKTGIAYRTGVGNGVLDSLLVYGGAARASLEDTHDVALHGTMLGKQITSPLIYLEAGEDFRVSSKNFGILQVPMAGTLKWRHPAPVYWNSFGVEGVLGYEHIMMPPAMDTISDFLHSLTKFSAYSKPVLSIDSYDQGIYSVPILQSIAIYGEKNGQQMGFYCSPFSLWTWSNNIQNAKLPGTDVPLREVILRDEKGKPIHFKDGEWRAYPMDPTHPATRQAMINQIEKAKFVHARFIKIDFLTAGSLESASHYDKNIRTGMQAYNYGMKLFKHLVDSIMGLDIFVSMAISPMFPHQYAHTRFVSTDVHSHLRDSQPGFPHYGSTAASMITASYMTWVQGTLWPYTNMDVLVMNHFQGHPPLSETEVKVRLFCLMTMGSILGDGSDYREPLAAWRARKYLDNADVAKFFAAPQAFIPIRMASGESMDQQLSFYLPGDGRRILLSAFDFDVKNEFKETFYPVKLGMENSAYRIVDFLKGETIGRIAPGQSSFSLNVPPGDALMVRLEKYPDKR
ncbi:hypothetical protein SAMN05216436_103156 [bacterium A37T11]|nr:hypothetical protein SAMN05216436_103156 [bacterium A37T11]